MRVVKRDGREVPYDKQKIVIAITKANNDTDMKPEMSDVDIAYAADKVEASLKELSHDPGIEEIQELVETQLMRMQMFETAKHYTRYRNDRARDRRENTTDAKIMSLIAGQNREMAEENANKSTILASTQRDYIAGIVSRDITNRKILPKRISDAHNNGVLHFHDADYFIEPIANCCLLDLGNMLDNGLVMNEKLVESPKSFQVACTVLTQIIACVASNQYGGQSADLRHLGKYLRASYYKYIKKIETTSPELGEEETIKLARMLTTSELKSGVQTIQYQINTLMTTNGTNEVDGRCKIA